MQAVYYIGLDVHKKKIAYCIQTSAGKIVDQGMVASTRPALSNWVAKLPTPWAAAMEATLFTGWIYDFLKPHASALKVAHPAMLKAITAAKKKNDKDDAKRIADLLRIDLLPECYMAPSDIRELRRVLRFRNKIVRHAVSLKNKTAGLLMEVGAEYSKRRLHGKRYFHELLIELDTLDEIPTTVVEMLRMNRAGLELFEALQLQLVKALATHSLLADRVKLLMTIRGIGVMTALTWALEVGEVERFASISKAISYCGLCSAQQESAGKTKRGPLSKKRNKHLQTKLIEAAKLAPQWHPELQIVHDRELARSNPNRATLAVARKLVAYLMAVDRRGTPFVQADTTTELVN